MIKYFFQFLELMCRGIMALISLFMLLCLNVLTMPTFIVLWLCCKVFRQQTLALHPAITKEKKFG